MPAHHRSSLVSNLVGGLGSCALLLSVARQPATADTLGDLKNKAQNAASGVPAPPTQAQINEAKARLQRELQQAWSTLQQRVSGIINQQRQ